jgi:protein phosphatase
MHIRTCAQSDLGRSRSVNEDSYLLDEDGSFCLVADGMGGHGNGEVASRVAVEAMARHLRESSTEGQVPSNDEDWLRRNAMRLRGAVEAANREVLAEVEKDATLAGMGATLVALLIEGDTALVGHVGDSRAYRLREGGLEQLTEDHTWVREQILAGFLSEDDARLHPFRSVVTRAVGGADEVAVDIEPIDLRSGDLLLLCSDGLNAVLSDEEIADHLQQKASLETISRRLIESANDGGGPDNITVVLLEVGDSSDQPPKA